MIECKEAFLDSEINLVKEFLAKHDLVLDEMVDLTLYLTDDKKVIGTISKYKYIIKCVAVDPSYQGEDLTGLLVNKIVEKMTEEHIGSYTVFTKKIYEKVFASLGFKKISDTSDAVMLEKGPDNISSTIEEMKKIINNNIGSTESNDVGCIVMNANPYTLGHEYLIEQALANHEKVIVFLVSEELSEFSYKERVSLVYLGTARYKNLVILPSSRYIVSSFTFPNYFIKSAETRQKNIAELDAKIFKDYFMKELHISKRYVGSETKDYMDSYNKILKDILGDSLIELPRISKNDEIVSASTVRNLLKEGKLDEALQYIPRECHQIMSLLGRAKYGCK